MAEKEQYVCNCEFNRCTVTGSRQPTRCTCNYKLPVKWGMLHDTDANDIDTEPADDYEADENGSVTEFDSESTDDSEGPDGEDEFGMSDTE